MVPCECMNPWIGYNGSELYVSIHNHITNVHYSLGCEMNIVVYLLYIPYWSNKCIQEPYELCGPDGKYPVCYVQCNADCGDVVPAQNPIRCQSKTACEEFRIAAIANNTNEGRAPARPEQTTSTPTPRPDFTEITTTPIRRNLREGTFINTPKLLIY